MSIKEDWDNSTTGSKVLLGAATLPALATGLFFAVSGAWVPGLLLTGWTAYCGKKGLEQSNPTHPCHDMMKKYPLHDDHDHFDMM